MFSQVDENILVIINLLAERVDSRMIRENIEEYTTGGGILQR
jgi:hypothetical protein